MTQVCSRKISERLGGCSYSWQRHQPFPGNVCKFWLTGSCTRNPCRFLHPDKAAHSLQSPIRVVCKRLNQDQNLRKVRQRTFLGNKPSVKCNHGGPQKPLVKCSDLSSIDKSSLDEKVVDIVKQNDGGAQNPSWSSSNEFGKMAQLEGHQKAVTGISLPSASDKLFTSSQDGTIRTWNCHTGECIGVAHMGSPVWCLESEGPWMFAGMTNAVKAWNIKTGFAITLDAPGGHVYSLAFCDKTLFGGLEDGSVFRWKLNSDDTSFEGPTVLEGHTDAVVSLFWGAELVYSGSLDKTVRAWDRESLLCTHTLQKHSEEIMSVLCWETYLLSSSLDKTLKVWGATQMDKIEVIHTHNEDHGILSLSGMHDAAKKPILLCSCSDNTLRLYDLPSFNERGRIFAKDAISAIHIGPRGLFFTGDKTGMVSVWQCSGDFSGSLDQVAA